MDARTAAIAADSACIRAGHAIKLRAVRHKYAAKVAMHASVVCFHARKLVRLHAKIHAEAVAIAGADYDEYHTVGFDEHCSIDEQLRDVENGSEISGAGLEDVVEMPDSMRRARRRVRCAARAHLQVMSVNIKQSDERKHQTSVRSPRACV
jgi:hypothetical protein